MLYKKKKRRYLIGHVKLPTKCIQVKSVVESLCYYVYLMG